MSWTKGQLIDAAFGELGLRSGDFSLQPHMLESALNRLEAMMAEWNGDGMRLGFNNQDRDNSRLTDDSNLPDWSIKATFKNLAIEIAPLFRKQVSPETVRSASISKDTAMSRVANSDPVEMEYPSTLPLGAGNRASGRTGQNFFPQPGRNIEAGPDGDLDFY